MNSFRFISISEERSIINPYSDNGRPATHHYSDIYRMTEKAQVFLGHYNSMSY